MFDTSLVSAQGQFMLLQQYIHPHRLYILRGVEMSVLEFKESVVFCFILACDLLCVLTNTWEPKVLPDASVLVVV